MVDLATDLAAVETFAQLCAQLDGTPARREQILAGAGLDEAGWQRLRAAWLPRLVAGAAPELASHFAQTYARARHNPEALGRLMACPATPRTDVPHRIDDEATTPDPPRDALPETDVDRTAELASPLVGSPLPFCAPEPASPAARSLCPPSAAPDPAEMTLEVPCAPPPPHAVLPFVRPVNGRRQRLVRFDTATGKPLAQPYWIDDPTPPAR